MLRDDVKTLLPVIMVWLIAVLPKEMQLIMFFVYIFVMCVYEKKVIEPDAFVTLQIGYIGVYILAVICNAGIGYHDASRVMAAINSVGISILSIIGYNMYRKKYINPDILEKAGLCNVLITIGLAFLSQIISNGDKIAIFGKTLTIVDYVNGRLIYRFRGFLDYTNLVALMILFFLPYAIQKWNHKPLKQIILVLAALYTVYLTNSRLALLLFCAYTLICILMVSGLGSFILKNKKRIVLIFVIGFLLSVLLFGNQIGNKLISVINMRAGSSGTRLYIYTSSIKKLIEESPLIGMGIKDMVIMGDGTQIQFPYGSHSTYIGVFYKAGILGGILYIFSIVYIVMKILKKKSNNEYDIIKKMALIIILVIMCAEVIDGSDWGIFMMYMMLSIYLNANKKDKKYEHSINWSGWIYRN